MVALSSSIRYATYCIKFSYRSFHFSSPVASTKRSSTKTVKLFTDLPTTLLRLDGTPAPPLPEWWGGADPEPLSISTDYSSRKRRKVTKADALTNDTPIDLAQKLHPASSENATDENITLSPIKPKRGRKAKVVQVAPSPILINPPQQLYSEGSAGILKKDVEQRSEKEPTSVANPPDSEHLPGTQETDDVSVQKVRSQTTDKKRREASVRPQSFLAKEILENLRKFPHCLLLTRVGQFYESYFDQAKEISRLLNIKLTTRKWNGDRVPMCGFPLIHIDKHLKVLVQQNNRFVAMCEEFPYYSNVGVKLFERRVNRIITPGTLIDEPFLNPYENNYLLAVSTPNSVDPAKASAVGLAWIDVSTGEFFSKPTNFDELRDELTRIGPREVVLDKRLEFAKSHPIYAALAEDDNFISYSCPSDMNGSQNPTQDDLPGPSPTSQGALPVDSVSDPGALDSELQNTVLSSQERSAIAILTSYLHVNLLEHMPVLSLPRREGTESRMQIDSHTIKALEIRQRIREDGIKGSLLSVIKKTITSGGTRLLARWLCSPSTSLVEINARQSLVAFFCSRPNFRTDLALALADAEDTGRIVQKFSLGRGDSNDLLAVKRTTQVWAAIKKRVEEEKRLEVLERTDFNEEDWRSLDSLMSRMARLDELSARISTALEDSPPAMDESQTPGPEPLEVNTTDSEKEPSEVNVFWPSGVGKWTIKPGFSSTLAKLHTTLRRLFYKREKLEQDLQLTYDAPSLTLRASPAHGMHVHIAKVKRDQTKINAAPEFITIAESGSTRCYFYKDWSQLGSKISEATIALGSAEKEAFEILRNEVNILSPSLRRNAKILDELDVVLAFANLATEMNFVRPVLTEEPIYQVVDGRHPTVELGLLTTGRVFTPNSIELSPASKLHVITGPNMAGKSTFLRQTALIAILAQTGSFVPADSAVIGIVDKLFSRVGAKDDLFHDRSTFMVEMLETAEILRRATPQSLVSYDLFPTFDELKSEIRFVKVIMDEVGRGTTVTDGLAIAYATLHHLVSTNRSRSLFATHFHELADMLGYPNQQGIFGTVGFFCTDVDETDDSHFTYQYRVRPGVNRDSHGLKVAQLAGMPSAAMVIAKETLSLLKARDATRANLKDEQRRLQCPEV